MSVLGRPRLHLSIVDSTNERAKALAQAGAPHGTLVTASEQTQGRGRQGRRWASPAGSSLLMSLVLRAPPEASAPLLPLIAAVALCDALDGRARVKWPNDIVLERNGTLAKLAGILVEGRPQDGWAVLGIGVNVAVRVADLPPQLRTSAATLGKTREAIEPLLQVLLEALARRLSEPSEAVLSAWRALDALQGRHVSWAGGEGRAEGIDDAGRLLVGAKDGVRTALAAGEVHLLGSDSYSSGLAGSAPA